MENIIIGAEKSSTNDYSGRLTPYRRLFGYKTVLGKKRVKMTGLKKNYENS
jgi:hypothetical protein